MASPALRFALLLAERLHKTLSEILELDPHEIALWLAWYQRHNPDKRADGRFGLLISELWAMHGKAHPPELFFPSLKEVREPETEEEFRKRARTSAGKIIKRKGHK